jgi:transposase-like protein
MIIIKCPKCKAKHQLAKSDVLAKTETITAFKCKGCSSDVKLKINKN